MDYTSEINHWKNSRLNNSLTRYKFTTLYNNESCNLNQIKEILKKYIEIPKMNLQNDLSTVHKKLNIKQVRRLKMSSKKNYFYETELKCKPIFYEPLIIHCRSSNLKNRKTKAKIARTSNNSSMIVQKLSYSRPINSKQINEIGIKKQKKRNSSYSSYSDVFKGLLEKIPLQK